METRVFISYRREDSSYPASTLHHFLAGKFGSRNIFFDVESVPYGADFVNRIGRAIEQSSCVIAMIGPEWARRIGEDSDFVRREIEIALRAEIPVLPVFVGNLSQIPDGLPPSISSLRNRNGIRMRPGIADQARDLEEIHASIRRLASPAAKPTVPVAPEESFDRDSQLDHKALLKKAWELSSARKYDEMIRYYVLAATNGSGAACRALVEIYSDGKFRDRDPREVARWHRVAAELGDRQSQYEIGSSYAMGFGVPVDFGQARYWLRLAAADRHKPASILLSHLESPLFRLAMRIVGRLRLSERFGKYEF
jgi:hypothetical protein